MDQTKKKRCPNGYIRDRKTGECVKKSETKKSESSIGSSIQQKTQKNKKCKKGTTENKTTGKCEEATVNPEQIPVDQISVANPDQIPDQTPVANSEQIPEQISVEQNPDDQISEDLAVALYPHLDDPEFQSKIAQHQEFAETKYDGDIRDIQVQADLMCTAKYELMPHQTFVKNFLSTQTPYNSLLLFHMLGTGKTCSAIGIAEEMRKYLLQTGMTKKKIMVIASPNVQSNFRKELFDDRKLKEVNGIWTMDRTCIGNSLLREINPTNMKGLEKRQVIQQIDAIIHQYYDFMGYGTFLNKMRKLKIVTSDNKIDKARVRQFFDHQLVIIDEVHNIRVDDTNHNQDNKRVGVLLQGIANHSENMRLLLLSATPMYNSPTEIVWLVNLLNAVDNRPAIQVRDVFESSGELKSGNGSKSGNDSNGSGRDLLRRKLNGYVSFVRGENPYLFPFRVYPTVFDPARLLGSANYPAPTLQMNSKEIAEPLRHVPVYMNPVGDYQKRGYEFIIQNIVQKVFFVRDKRGQYKERNTGIFENMESFGYTMLNSPIQSLNMVYPSDEFDTIQDNTGVNTEDLISSLIGKGGLERTMTYQTEESPPRKYDFEYKLPTNRFFSPTGIARYGAKIARICECIRSSTGIVLVYSQYIDGGIVPLALALEEMGLTRYASDESHRRNLFKRGGGGGGGKNKIAEIDALTMKTRKEMGINVAQFRPAKYVMITGDKYYSANKTADIKYVTSPENANGELVKVVLISKAASEGVDFKNIRQIHILEPWYNMNRIEQTIGRAVRTRSHCDLPFIRRNVEIYLHASHFEQEAADLYLYRVAEKKAIQIGKITRLIKQTAVDCVLNISQSNFTADQLMKIAENEHVQQELSSFDDASGSPKIVENFPVGDRPYTDICDYMETCELKCENNESSNDNNESMIRETYSEDFLKTNSLVIMQKIRDLFADRFVFTREELIRSINLTKKYPIDHIYYALSKLVGNMSEELVDHYGRIGYLVNRGSVYAFQPAEIFDENATVYDRMRPVDKKNAAMQFELRTEIKKDFSMDDDSMDNSMDHKDAIVDSMDNSMDNSMYNSKDDSKDDSIVDSMDHKDSNKDATKEKQSKSKKSKINTILQNLTQSITWVLQDNLQIQAGDKDWYKHLNRVFNVLAMSQIYAISKESLVKYAVFHFLDILKIEDRLEVLSFIYKVEKDEGRELFQDIREYFQQRILRNRESEKIYVVLASDLKNVVYSNRSNQWVEVTSYSELKQLQEPLRRLLQINPENMYGKIGFMFPFKDQGVLFKIKDREQADKKNNQGAVCLSAKKEVVIQRINDVLGMPVYKNDKTFDVVDCCVILEVLLRDKTEQNGPNGPIYFFSPEKTIFNKITEK